MAIDFDPAKSARNALSRGLPFSIAAEFGWGTAIILPDTRFPYPEPRYRATGMLRGELHMLVFTPIMDGFRVISLRKASRKERRSWPSDPTRI